MPYILKRDLPGAKAGSEVAIRKTDLNFSWIEKTYNRLSIALINNDELSDWVEDTSKPKRIELVDVSDLDTRKTYWFETYEKINELINAFNKHFGV